MAWTERDIPDQTGRTAVITGANSGLGLATTRALAGAGARVVMACRSIARAERAAGRIRREVPGADLRILEVDLGSLASVREATAAFHGPIDLLIANAGVMAGTRTMTEDGFERQMGINHFGHFAFISGLLPQMTDVCGSRIVLVSSIAARNDTLDVEDLDTTRNPEWMVAYGASKQANAVHAQELHRRLVRSGAATTALAAHPGVSMTGLGDGMFPEFLRPILAIPGRIVLNSARQGARPQLRAATDPDASGGQYYGSSQLAQMRGPAKQVPLPPRADDPDLGEHLWDASVARTGVDPGI